MRGKKLACFLLVCLSLVACNAGDDDQFVYSGFAGRNLILDGAASITASGLLELTNGTLRLKGHAIYPTLLRFRDQAPGGGAVRSFSASFVFGILSAYPDVSANGIAFFIAPSKDFSGAMAAQYLGLLNSSNNGNATNRVFAVELDTMQNNEFKDINDNHVGIDINGLVSVNSTNAGHYDDSNDDFHSLTLIIHEAMQAWVDYDGETKRINVTLAPLKMGKPVKPLLSVTYDLSTVIPDMAYIGFSSSTGLVNSRHYVLGWSFAMDGRPAPAIDIAKLPKLPSEFPKPRSKVTEIILPIATAALVLFAVTILVLLRRRQLRYRELNEDWEVEFGPHRFSFKDLFRATEGFKNKNLLGVGGFGKVYRGVLMASKSEIAVKRVSHNSKQGMKEFVAEIVSIGRMQHPNVVQLLGYCRRKGELLLVYEYMSNGSLDKYLYCNEAKSTLNWTQRLHIIKGMVNTRHYVLGWSFGMNNNGSAPAIDATKLPKLPQLGSKPRSKVLEITLPLATAALVLAMGTAMILLLRRRLRYTEVREDWEMEFGPHRFTYKDLFHATKGFKDKYLIGAGGFGMVYKGVLPTSGSKKIVR